MVLTTPILEGLDGVNKMSKSLGNAIGIHEPPLEMYGKVMRISDEMMWRYWELLTDVSVAEIEKMKFSVGAGGMHPMNLKKELARRIVADFYSQEVASDAAEEWASQVQKRELPEEMKLVALSLKEVGPEPIKLARVLKAVGLAPSVSYATLKIKEGAVSVNEVKTKDLVAKLPIDRSFVLRLGHSVREVRIVSTNSSTSLSS